VPYQTALTIGAPVRPGAEGELDALLRTMGDGVANGSVLDFGAIEGVHFGRVFVVPAETDETGKALPAYLFLLVDADVSKARILSGLAQSDGIDVLFGHCEGYSPGGGLAYLRRHVVKEGARYVNTVGRTSAQIRQEAVLREAVQRFLDAGDWRGKEPREVRRAVREHVAADPELAWALEPADRPGFLARARAKAHMVGVLLLSLPLLPFAILGTPLYAVVLRRHERRDPAPHVRPDEAWVHGLAELEDHLVHNPFTALGHVKQSQFRRLTLTVILFYLDWAARHVFNHGNLSGVKTIHFARWVVIDDKRRAFFASNYDGSVESYMDDFIDKVAWGLNLVFSNGVGYPKVRWLVFGGAKDELAFKDFLRLHQIPTRVWYSAYGNLTALNVQQNERLRAGLHGELSDEDQRAWVEAL
jgi:hypothetical protein